MSTKIYYGVRFPLGRLAEFIQSTRVLSLRMVERQARRLLSLEPGPELESQPSYRRVRGLLRKIQRAATGSVRDVEYDFDHGWSLWLPARSHFVLGNPWGSLGRATPRPEWVESYPYWDNTDRDPNVTVCQWKQRETDWEIACGPSHENHCVVLHCFESSEKLLDIHWLGLRLEGDWKVNGEPCGTPAVFPSFKVGP